MPNGYSVEVVDACGLNIRWEVQQPGTEQARSWRYCEECKRERSSATNNSRGDFTFDEFREWVREYFGRS